MKQSSGSRPVAARPRYEGGWRMAVVYFGLVSLGFSQPLFETINLYRSEFYFTLSDAVVIVLVFQCLAAAVLTAAAFLTPSPGPRRILDLIVTAGVGLMLLRQIQIFHFTAAFAEFSGSGKIIIMAGIVAAIAAFIFIFRRILKIILFYAGVISPVFGVMFIYSMMTHEVPLAAAQSFSEKNATPAAAYSPAVVLAVMDELSADFLRGPGGGMDAETFPNFTRLAARGTQWSNAVTNYVKSSYSFPSLLKSELPVAQDQTGRNYILRREGLFDAFGDAGYRLHAYSDYFQCAGDSLVCKSYLNADNPHFLLRTFVKFISVFQMNFMHGRVFPSLHKRRLDFQNAHLIKTVKTARPGTFHLAHMLSTHQPYFLDAECAAVRPPRSDAFGPDDNLKSIAADAHEHIRCVDLIMGGVLDAIDARPADAPLVLMLVSDHGNCWTTACPGRTVLKAMKVIEPSLVNVPVMLLSPLHEPRIDEDDFQLIDVAPTLCEAAGLKGCGDYGFDGVSRLNNPPPPRPRQFFLDPARPPVDIPLPARPVPAPPPPKAD